MDDETYVKMDFKTLPGPQFFTKSQSQILPDELTQRSVEKFGPKILVLQAICSCGERSRIFITKGTNNKELYINL